MSGAMTTRTQEPLVVCVWEGGGGGGGGGESLTPDKEKKLS